MLEKKIQDCRTIKFYERHGFDTKGRINIDG